MAPPPSVELDRARINQLLDALVDQLDGDWLLVGGALAALWRTGARKTEDVDLVPMAAGASRGALLEAAFRMGLPVEAVNSAADFFVHRIPGWQTGTSLLKSGAKGRVFRPSWTVFVLLKMGRLSGADLEDCLDLLGRADVWAEIDASRLLSALGELPSTADAALAHRRERLRTALAARA